MSKGDDHATDASWQALDDGLKAMKTILKNRKPAEKPSAQVQHHLEWRLLVSMFTDPSIIPEIELNENLLTGSEGITPHQLLYHAMKSLHEDGQIVDFEHMIVECQKIQKTLLFPFSISTMMELEFQRRTKYDPDLNRVRAKFCTEQIAKNQHPQK